MPLEGQLHKMKTTATTPVSYHLVLGEEEHDLMSFRGQKSKLTCTGQIRCISCNRPTKKSWQQGHCFPCTQKLAACDICIVKPELCHYAQGTCREPEWGEAHCLKPHIVYLANSSGLKVGITRESQVPTRWMDQGAMQALPIMRVSERLKSGQVEIIFGELVADKTHWQKLLKGMPEVLDLESIRDDLMVQIGARLETYGPELLKVPVQHFSYPVTQWPEKIKSYNPEKVPVIEDRLMGIKGQYLMFENGVLNVRSHAGHIIRWESL